MKKIIKTAGFFFLLIVSISLKAQVTFRTGSISLDADLNQINVSARADFGRFSSDLNVTYGVPARRIEYFHRGLRMEPAEIYLALEVSRISHRPVDQVIEVYRSHRGQGWGNIAKEAGIRPGSREFFELKDRCYKNKWKEHGRGYREKESRDDNDRGNGNGHGNGYGHGNGNGHGNGKGHGNDHGRGNDDERD